jgi:hypothetical protein
MRPSCRSPGTASPNHLSACPGWRLERSNGNMNIMILPSRIVLCGALLALLVALGVVWAQLADAPALQPSADSMPIDVDRGAAGLTRWLHALQTRASPS